MDPAANVEIANQVVFIIAIITTAILIAGSFAAPFLLRFLAAAQRPRIRRLSSIQPEGDLCEED